MVSLGSVFFWRSVSLWSSLEFCVSLGPVFFWRFVVLWSSRVFRCGTERHNPCATRSVPYHELPLELKTLEFRHSSIRHRLVVRYGIIEMGFLGLCTTVVWYGTTENGFSGLCTTVVRYGTTGNGFLGLRTTVVRYETVESAFWGLRTTMAWYGTAKNGCLGFVYRTTVVRYTNPEKGIS